jgi:hypothetical protein
MSCKAVRDVPSDVFDGATSVANIVDGNSEAFQWSIEREDS